MIFVLIISQEGGGEMLTILKEIKQLLEDILSELKKQKEPTAVTVDSEKLSKSPVIEQKIRRLSGQ